MPEHDGIARTSGRHAAPETDDAPAPTSDDTAAAADPAVAEWATVYARAAGSRAAHRAARPRRRLVVTVAVTVAVAVAAAGALFVAGMMTAGSGTPTPPVVAVVATPVAAPPIVPAATTPTPTSSATPTTASRTTASSTRTRTTVTSTRPAADTASGCGPRAVARGVFNAACSEYQGYLDPGRAAGRAPSSGDLQHDDGCRMGSIPKSEC